MVYIAFLPQWLTNKAPISLITGIVTLSSLPCIHTRELRAIHFSHLPGIFFAGARVSSNLMRTMPFSRSVVRFCILSPLCSTFLLTQAMKVLERDSKTSGSTWAPPPIWRVFLIASTSPNCEAISTHSLLIKNRKAIKKRKWIKPQWANAEKGMYAHIRDSNNQFLQQTLIIILHYWTQLAAILQLPF